MSDKPELTAVQMWILQAQREILRKDSVPSEAPPAPQSQAA